MFSSLRYLIKMLYVIGSFIFLITCDEDYVNSLTGTANPKVFLEVINELDNAYLGESVDVLQLSLHVEDSPAISFLSFSVDFNPSFFQANDIIVAPSQDNLFYNLNSDAIIQSIIDTTSSSFEISIGFNLLLCTVIDPTSSPETLRKFLIFIFAFAFFKTLIKYILVSLQRTLLIVSFEFGVSKAIAIRKAAELGSELTL